MAHIRPFKAIMPADSLANQVAALPYDVVSTEEAQKIVKNNPYSFLHVDKPEIDFEDIDPYDKRVYERARDNLNKMIADNILIEDTEARLYIYRLIKHGVQQTGIVCCIPIDDYLNSTVKKHELTQQIKQIDRTNHVEYCNANTGPIFLTHEEDSNITKLIEKCMSQHNPKYSFKAEDATSQQVWAISEKDLTDEIIERFKSVKSLYIADGHHRCAAAADVCLKKREQNPNYTGEEEFNYCMAVIFPSSQLRILEYNRVVKDLNGLTESEFLEKLKAKFEIQICEDSQPYHPKKAHTFGMYMNKKWYCISAKTTDYKDEIENLDVSILQNEILSPILKITDPRTDDRIEFVGGVHELDELVDMVDSGKMKVAFSMYPTSIKDLMSIADAGKIMPPKSTWFEPKLRSGIFIHML